MKPMHRLLVAFSWFGTGVMLPVLSLLLLSRGCTLTSLGIVIGAYSASVIVAELPTGIFSDLYGRKTSVLLSCALYAASFLMILLADSLIWLFPAMILQGVGRAFASGSLEALVIEASLAHSGEASVPRAASSLNILQSISIASGAVVGGILPASGGYAFHIILRITILTFVFLLTLVFVKENKRSPEHRASLKEHLSRSAKLFAEVRTLRYVFILIAVSSVMMFTVETFWQPAFTGIAGDQAQYFLGFLCTGGFVVMAFGSFLAGKMGLHSERARWVAYLASLGAMSVMLVLIAFIHSTAVFTLCYVGWYLFLGIANTPEQTIINLAVPDETRAAVLSASSLSCQLGGIVSSAVCALVIAGTGFSAIWLIGPALTVMAEAFIIWRVRKTSSVMTKI